MCEIWEDCFKEVICKVKYECIKIYKYVWILVKNNINLLVN